MNMEVVLLFVNAMLVSVVALVVVIVILRRNYLPVIRELEKEKNNANLEENNEISSWDKDREESR